MDNSINLDINEVEGLTVVKLLIDRLDAAAAPDFKSQIDELIANGSNQLVLDLEKLEFMDSSGLGSIVACYKKMQGSGEMMFCGANDSVKSIFKLTRMDRIFQIFDTLDDCLLKKSA